MATGDKARQDGASAALLVFTVLLLGFHHIHAAPLQQREARRPRLSQDEVRTKLSKVFGVSPSVTRQRHHMRSPPQYMLELYNAVADRNGLTKFASPFAADVIRSFPDRDMVTQWHYFYNVTNIGRNENILEAEFHLFKMRSRVRHSKRHRAPHIIELKVYQVVDEKLMHTGKGVKLLDARRISAHTHGWEVFNVKDAVVQWMNDSKTNHGFLVTASTLDGKKVNGTWVRFAQRSEHHNSKQPIMVLFNTGDANSLKDIPYVAGFSREHAAKYKLQHRQNKGRQNRNYNAVRWLNEKDREELTQQQPQNDSPSTGKSRSKRQATNYYFSNKRKQTCSRHDMYVDFGEIGWSGWIISPKGYNAYHCKGQCPFPLGQNQKPTNHATVQSIVHALKVGKDVTTPCCVPNKLYPISLLYFDDDENVILKQYDDMVAASCGCH